GGRYERAERCEPSPRRGHPQSAGAPAGAAHRRRTGRARSLGAARAAAHRAGRSGRRADPAPVPSRSRPLPGPRQADRAEGGDQGRRRQLGRLRRRARAAPGAQPRAGDRRAGDRPHGDHPRHLRRPRELGGGQAAGRARPARVQPRAHARAVDPPRAPRRRAHGRRHRHPWPGRDPDRDRPSPRSRPHYRAEAPPRAHPGHALDHAQRARARAPAHGRARGLHQRRQIDAAERAHRRHRWGARPPLPHPRPDHPLVRDLRPRVPADRHRRLHPQASPSARRGLRGDARGDPARRPDRARGRRLRVAGGDGGDDPRRRGRAGGDRGGGAPAAARSQQDRRARGRAPARALVPPPASDPGLGRDRRGARRAASGHRGGVPAHPAPDGPARALQRGRAPRRAARPCRRARARGHARWRAGPGAGPRGGGGAVRAVPRCRGRQRRLPAGGRAAGLRQSPRQRAGGRRPRV
ncbi:MAG: Ribosome LSU-associated GTP-binding protein HflX, partial [uncultured Solirubrobacterales bacterium]